MSMQMESEQSENVATLVGGIVQDARDLVLQQMQLFQVDIKDHLRRVLIAAIILATGMTIALPAVFLLGSAGAHYVCWQWPALPLWAGFAIVGGVGALLGAGLGLLGKSMLAKAGIVPDKALQGLKENLQWKTKK